MAGDDSATVACAEGRLSRRGLLGAGISFFAWTHGVRVASAAGARDPRFLVVILRGALDGLAAVPPIGDPAYAALRAEVALPTVGMYAALPLDGYFALHPAMPELARLYRDGKASIVHAVATPYRERSHFDGQDVLESGLPGVGRADSGWLNRAMLALAPGHPVRVGGGLGVGPATPLILRGAAPVKGWAPQALARADEDLTGRLLALYRHSDPRLAEGLEAAIALDRVARGEGLAEGGQAPRGGPGDPRGMEQAAEGAAMLLRAAEGPRVAALSFDGWDTHANQGGATGRLARLLAGLDVALATFERVLAPCWRDTVVVVVTEFGRTARINGTEGSDHGTGTVAFLLGGAVRGGRMFARWPGVAAAQLHENRDLRATTDLRAVLKGLMMEHLGLSAAVLAERIFPDSGAVPAMRDLLA